MFRPASVLCLCALAARGDALDWNRLAPLPDARGVAAPLAGVHGGALVGETLCVGTVPCVEWRGRLILPSGEVRPGVRSPDTWSFVPRHP